MDLSCQKKKKKKWHPIPLLQGGKWNGVPVLAAKNSTILPKMELLKKVQVLAAKHKLFKLLFTMTTKLEAKEFLAFTFPTFVQQQNHSS